MSVEFTSILTTFIVIFILLMAPCLAGDSSRDLLLTIRNKAAPLDHRVRQLVSRLGYRYAGAVVNAPGKGNGLHLLTV